MKQLSIFQHQSVVANGRLSSNCRSRCGNLRLPGRRPHAREPGRTFLAAPSATASATTVSLEDLRGTYDPAKLEKYFEERPTLVAKRLAQILALISIFAAKRATEWFGETVFRTPLSERYQLIDAAGAAPGVTPAAAGDGSAPPASLSTSSIDETMRQEADGVNSAVKVSIYEDVCNLLAVLGPCFIKLGQTLSTRTDLVGPDLAAALARLQDGAPPFPLDEAREVLRSELPGLTSVSTLLGPAGAPVAAASLGQVYRARLRDGREVAVKVQRPAMLEKIAVDVYILRRFAAQVRAALKINRDLGPLVDELGGGLMAELDFTKEAANADEFRRAHERLPFIAVPRAVPEYSTRRVLTTEWADGVSPRALARLAAGLPAGLSSGQASPTLLFPVERPPSALGSAADIVYVPGSQLAPEVARARLLSMVELGVRCSLSQLLETGVMHADPHPGNLLLAPDGRLFYLDFGLLTRVPAHHREAMMGAVVHLVLGRWAALVEDFRRMEILKPETDPRALAEDLKAQFLKNAPEGATAPPPSALTFRSLTGALLRLALRYKFKLPPYYTLVVRSLATLEGVALQADPNFKILEVAFPVVLERLVCDNRRGPRRLLKELLFGPDGLQVAQAVDMGKLWLGPRASELLDNSGSGPKAASDGAAGSDMMERAVSLALSRRASPLRRVAIEADPTALLNEALRQPRVIKALAGAVRTFAATWVATLAAKLLGKQPVTTPADPAARVAARRASLMARALASRAWQAAPLRLVQLLGKVALQALVASLLAAAGGLVQSVRSTLGRLAGGRGGPSSGSGDPAAVTAAAAVTVSVAGAAAEASTNGNGHAAASASAMSNGRLNGSHHGEASAAPSVAGDGVSLETFRPTATISRIGSGALSSQAGLVAGDGEALSLEPPVVHGAAGAQDGHAGLL